jgi:hypothetical protein
MFFGGSNWKRKALTNPRFGQDAALRCLVMNDAREAVAKEEKTKN